MRKRLVKRPLLAYASGKKGDVYGYDWSLFNCTMSALALVGSSSGLGGSIAAGPVTWPAAICLSSAVVGSGILTYVNCKWW